MSKRCTAVLMLIFIMSLSSNFASSVPYDQYTSHPSYTSYEDSSYDTDTGGSGTSDSGYYTDDEDVEYVLPETGDYVDGYEAVLKNNEKVKNSVPESNWFSCDNNKLWLTLDKKCDGIRDCFNCSDENNCTHATDSQFFFCYEDAKDTDTKGNATYSFNDPYCIPKHQFCNGEKDCFSGADEKQIGYGFKCVVKGSQKTCLLAFGTGQLCFNKTTACRAEIVSQSVNCTTSGTVRLSSSKPSLLILLVILLLTLFLFH
ncbi:uncharacterized protein LOC143465294 [Clavelina lepadiformis]|uniref:uncharacterized protein LOC143465294 n=1 Tax=Clavelina lepadiformis TaxID=159417 RepID=UPI0040437A59